METAQKCREARTGMQPEIVKKDWLRMQSVK